MSANYFRHTDREPHKALFACGSHDRVDTEVLLYHDQTELEKKRKNQTITYYNIKVQGKCEEYTP